MTYLFPYRVDNIIKLSCMSALAQCLITYCIQFFPSCAEDQIKADFPFGFQPPPSCFLTLFLPQSSCVMPGFLLGKYFTDDHCVLVFWLYFLRAGGLIKVLNAPLAHSWQPTCLKDIRTLYFFQTEKNEEKIIKKKAVSVFYLGKRTIFLFSPVLCRKFLCFHWKFPNKHKPAGGYHLTLRLWLY